MGFFSSLRGTDSTTNASSTTNGDNTDKSTPKQKTVIRSRFYGSSTRNKKSPAPVPHKDAGRSVGGVDEVPVAGPSRSASVRAPSPPPPPPPIPQPTPRPESVQRTIHHSQSQTLPRARPPKANPAPAAHRASTTAVTTALATRLAELAAANAAGLLDDDEYRLLRQNLFERVPGADAVPQEEPLVRINAQPTPREQPTRPPSQFSTHTTAPSLAPTTRSRTSVSSAVGSLFRRATGRTSSGQRFSVSVDDADASDINGEDSANGHSYGWAGTVRGRLGARKTSESSLRDDAASTYSHSRRRPSAPPSAFNSPVTHHKPLPPPLTTSISSHSLSTSRSASALPASTSDTLAIERTNILDDALDDAHLKSASSIRAEIAALEAEGRRVLGAFDGLELTALTRRTPRTPITPSPASSSSHAHRAGSVRRPTTPSASLHQAPRTPGSTRRAFPWPPEDDASSMKSGVSGTSSRSRRAPRTPRTPGAGGGGHGSSTLSTSASFPLLSSGPGLTRRPSASSVSSHATSLPSHGVGHGMSRLGRLAAAGGSSSSLNLRGSSAHLPLAPVRERDSTELPSSFGATLSLDTDAEGLGLGLSPGGEGGRRGRAEDGEEVEAAAREVADIRRRRAEVVGRYEERIEYLRAKLKGAELHEKLLRK
ncbi:hypothetical protein PENSPDRAFT_747901 [Peniophora sp. CONT]|nr:hypothetical protein PENSPDRAFT_747901 [Peniophora sp. CONT]